MGYTAMVEDADPEEEPVLYLVLDPVLSQEQMLAALDTLEGYREPVLYQGDAGAAGTEFTGLRAVGWREGQVLYVQKLTLCFETGEVVLADTQADLFPGQTPQSYSGTWVEFYSPCWAGGTRSPSWSGTRLWRQRWTSWRRGFPRLPREGWPLAAASIPTPIWMSAPRDLSRQTITCLSCTPSPG